MIKYADCKLRDMCESDLPQVFDWKNSKRIREISIIDREISYEEHQNWFAKMSQGPEWLCVFEYRDTPCGVIKTENSNPSENYGEWGFYIGNTGLARGLGKAMAWIFLDECFSHRSYMTIVGKVLDNNAGSLKFHETLGFQRLPDSGEFSERQGEQVAIFAYELLKDRWIEIRTKLRSRFFSD